MARYHITQPIEQPKPAPRGTLEADFDLPWRHARTTGALWFVFVTGSVGGGIIGLKSLIPDDGVSWGVLLVAPLAGLVCGFWALFRGWLELSNRIQQVRWFAETVTQIDLDQDGQIGRPEPIIVNARQPEQGERVNPYLEDYRNWIRALAFKGTAGREHPQLTRTQYETWRDSLMQAGFAAWNDEGNHNAGWKLTTSVEEILENVR